MSWFHDGFVSWYLFIVDHIVHYMNINNFQRDTNISFTHTVDTALRCINIRIIFTENFDNINVFVTAPKYVATL